LPLAYAGHIERVVWLKPPWCQQFAPDAVHHFQVGKHKVTGQLRVSCKQRYFLEEGLYAPESELETPNPLVLEVVTVSPHSDAPIHFATSNAVILDVCLDFFAVRSPFRDDLVAHLDEEAYAKLHRIYSARKFMQPPSCTAVEDPSAFCTAQQKFDEAVATMLSTRLYLRSLQEILACDVGESLMAAYDEGEGLSIVTGFVELLGCLHARQLQGLLEGGDLRIPNQLAEDDTHTVPLLGLLTSLPHHDTPGYREDAEDLLASFADLLKEEALPRPALITVARSAEDHYTPNGEAQKLERAVVGAVRGGAHWAGH